MATSSVTDVRSFWDGHDSCERTWWMKIWGTDIRLIYKNQSFSILSNTCSFLSLSRFLEYDDDKVREEKKHFHEMPSFNAWTCHAKWWNKSVTCRRWRIWSSLNEALKWHSKRTITHVNKHICLHAHMHRLIRCGSARATPDAHPRTCVTARALPDHVI